MRGSPVFRTLVAVIALTFTGLLLFRITHADTRSSTMSAETTHPAEAVPTLIRIRTSHPPKSLTLRLESKILAEFRNPLEQEWEIESSLAHPADGEELVLEASWEAALDCAAVTVELEPDALNTKSQTEWSDAGEIKAFLHFRWP